MEFSFTDEQEAFRTVLRRFLESKSPTTEVRRLMETEIGTDMEVWKQLSDELGLPGIHIPETYGGQGFSFVELGIILEEMGRALLCAPPSRARAGSAGATRRASRHSVRQAPPPAPTAPPASAPRSPPRGPPPSCSGPPPPRCPAPAAGGTSPPPSPAAPGAAAGRPVGAKHHCVCGTCAPAVEGDPQPFLQTKPITTTATLAEAASTTITTIITSLITTGTNGNYNNKCSNCINSGTTSHSKCRC